MPLHSHGEQSEAIQTKGIGTEAFGAAAARRVPVARVWIEKDAGLLEFGGSLRRRRQINVARAALGSQFTPGSRFSCDFWPRL
jgi:hypothetical protein